MTVTAAEIQQLAFPEDLGLAGVEYAKRNQLPIRERFGALTLDILRAQAAEAAVELAFRRWLDRSGASYRVSVEVLPIESGWGTVIFGGRRCELEASVVETHNESARMLQSLDPLLNVQVSARRHTSMNAGQDGADLLVFGLVHVEVIRSREESVKMEMAGKPIQMAALLPDECLQPRGWASMGQIEIANRSDEDLILEAVGYDGSRQAMVEEIRVKGHGSVVLDGDFFTLGSLYRRTGPIEKINIEIERYGKCFPIGRHQWGNVWIYGREVFLLGYMARREYDRAAKVRPGVRHLPGSEIVSRGVRVGELRSMDELLARSRRWVKKR